MTSNPCYPNGAQSIPIYGVSEEVMSSTIEANSSNPAMTHPSSFLYNLSLLKDRVHQVQSLATIFLSPDHGQTPESTTIDIPPMGTLLQEIIVTASSMMFASQQMALGSPPPTTTNSFELQQHHHRTNKVAETSAPQVHPGRVEESGPSTFYSINHHDTLDHWYGENYNNYNLSTDSNNTYNNTNNDNATPFVTSNSIELSAKQLPPKLENNEGSHKGILLSPKINYDIIELGAADLLAKYTHYCQVCGKGFKRDANLRMHMRAHGDEYKSSAALSNPMKNNSNTTGENVGSDLMKIMPRKYSCPQEGCRWNKNHAKFQPLKSMICVKNHYKRSHCPKMYICKRCNRKQFSVLSDLRTHEKHCGDLKWQCSCGTTFSRKDKLMGHVALFVGHMPAVVSSLVNGHGAQSHAQMQLDERRSVIDDRRKEKSGVL